MAFSGDIWVLNKIAELANRCGVSPAVANFELNLEFKGEDDDRHYCVLTNVDGNARTPAEEEGIQKVRSLLGFGDSPFLEFPNLMAVDEAVDRALALAPRPRVRDR